MKENLRAQLKATSIKHLRKQVDNDNEILGANSSSNEYLNLEDGKTTKIRIFPGHPGSEDFYVGKKCYWLSFNTSDGDVRRGTVLDSIVHGGTKMDIVQEYVKAAKKFIGNDSNKLEALVGTGPKSNSLNPQYSWLCYADKIDGDNQLRAKIWEFKKMVRDSLNKLALEDNEDEVITIDPFTDPDEGLPVNVTYRRNPNKKKGENYYEVSFPKKSVSRPLSDEEIEYFMSLKPLSEVVFRYGIKDFERALEGLQNFDEENEIGLFNDEDWLSHLEEIKAQYDSDVTEKIVTKKTVKKVVKKVEEVDDEEEDDEEEDDEEVDDEEEDDGDEFDNMDRNELKAYIKNKNLDIIVKKSMSDEDIREKVRKESEKKKSKKEVEEVDDEEEDDDEEPAKITLEDIRKKLAGK